VRRVSISNRIRELRFSAGEMTQQALADRVGITRQTIIALEQSRYYPSLELAFLIAETFGVGLEEVFQHRDDVRQSKRSTKHS
jgi:putative transcriptional regulator